MKKQYMSHSWAYLATTYAVYTPHDVTPPTSSVQSIYVQRPALMKLLYINFVPCIKLWVYDFIGLLKYSYQKTRA